MDNQSFLLESIAASFQKMAITKRADSKYMSKRNAQKALERANIYAIQAYGYKRKVEMVIG